MKDKKMLYGIGIVFLFLASVGFSYAYFTASIANKDVKDQVVTTGTLSLRYVDGPEINMQNIKPGSTITKTVYVANTGTLDASYNLVWQELINEITNDEMVIEVKCTRMNGQTEEVDGTCEGLTETPIKKIRIKDNVSIEPSIVHKYDITITFKEMNKDQNYNQNKKFSGVLGVKEYKAPETIYCTFDGELTQGAEYVNGQYTYRYMQSAENANNSAYIEWRNISSEGWGVTLTDKDSTEPVTSKVCTYINGKPLVSTRSMFYKANAKSVDLTSLNTSNVVDMNAMFSYSQFQTLDVSNFNTSKVNNMGIMFESSKATTIVGLNNFDTRNVTNMGGMFYESSVSTLDLSSFDTSKVTNMAYMFLRSSVDSIDVSKFNTSNVTAMNGMFSYTKIKELNVSNFNTSKVTTMSYMFHSTNIKSLDLRNFDTSNVTNMYSMFANSQAETINLSSFNTSKVTNMSNMFYNSSAATLDLSSFDTSKVTTMSIMFGDSGATVIKGLDKFNTSNVTNMSNMFQNSKLASLDLKNFDTSKVTNMGFMFNGAAATSLDLSSFNTSNVTDMRWMFANSKATSLDLSSFDISNVSNVDSMFGGVQATVGYAKDQATATKFNDSSVTGIPKTLTFKVK